MAESHRARNLSSSSLPPRGAASGRSRAESRTRAGATWAEKIRDRFRDWTSRPLFDYHLLLIVVGLLTGIGLVMVLSASMATAEGSVWGVFIRQVFMVGAGLLFMWGTMVMPVEWIRKLSTPAMGVSLILLILVLIPGIGTGREETGAQSWIVVFGGLTMQPSEVAKIALALWGSKLLADKVRVATSWVELFGMFSFWATLFLALVMFQGDLGMTASMAFVVFALALFAGLPRIVVTAIAGVGAVGMAVFITIAGFRSKRISVYLDSLLGNFNDVRGDAYQSYQGFLSLADGSMTGVGLGQSSAKWSYLPEAKNDFIFAIIGEEMGFIGAATIILLYATLGWVGLRIAGRQSDPFLRLLAGTLTLATVVQAFINIGYVVGALPVTGLQLPLISAGGTSALVTLLTMGLLASCARHEAEAVSAMQTSGRPGIDRLLGIPEPIPYDESSRHSPKLRSHREPQRFGPPVTTSGARAGVSRRNETRRATQPNPGRSRSQRTERPMRTQRDVDWRSSGRGDNRVENWRSSGRSQSSWGGDTARGRNTRDNRGETGGGRPQRRSR